MNNKNYSLIITHEGKFHADEIFAIASLRTLGLCLPVKRAVPTKKDLANPSMVVIDCGLSYDRSLSNFDHHQDDSLNSSCVLVWDNFFPETNDFEKNLKEIVRKKVFLPISDTDRGLGSNKDGLNKLVSNFNYLGADSFDKALIFAEDFLQAIINKEKYFLESRNLWDTIPTIGGNRLKFCKYPVIDNFELYEGWLYLAKSQNVSYLVSPSNRGGSFLMNFTEKSIPEDIRQTTRRVGDKVIFYRNTWDAQNHALEIITKN